MAPVELEGDFEGEEGDVVWAKAALLKRPKARAVLPTRIDLRISFAPVPVSTLQGVIAGQRRLASPVPEFHRVRPRFAAPAATKF
jgi:hypothetical protein